MISDKELIGKAVKGFKFHSKKSNGLHYADKMDRFVGCIGIIYTVNSNFVNIGFMVDNSRVTWTYPKELVIAQLKTRSTETEIFKIL